MVKVSRFDAVDYLDSEEMVAAYLTAAMEDENPDVFFAVLSDVAKARGIAQLAQDTGLGRESLYKSLAQSAKPRFGTIQKITKALDSVYTSYAKTFNQSAMQRICTAAAKDVRSFAYRVAIPLQRLRCKNAFSTR